MSSRLTPDALLAHCLTKPGAWQDEPCRRRHSDDEILEAVDASYATIVAKPPRAHRPIV
jgi:predicted DNA-binding protein (MmcQ/YjbR family)